MLEFSFMPLNNADAAVVEGFGDEWVRFDQSNLPDSERLKIFNQYFSIFPWDRLPADAHGFDAGCGSGRWAREVAGRVGHLNLIDASQAALDVAKRNLEGRSNAKFYCASVAEMPIEDASQDFGYSLGVLHHIPDTKAGLISCVKKLKAGAPFLVYLYYRFDNRPIWFQAIWRVSDGIRRVISVLPNSARYLISQIIAATVYWPLSRLAWSSSVWVEILKTCHLPDTGTNRITPCELTRSTGLGLDLNSVLHKTKFVP